MFSIISYFLSLTTFCKHLGTEDSFRGKVDLLLTDLGLELVNNHLSFLFQNAPSIFS